MEEVSALRARIGPLLALETQVSDLETLQLLADEETDEAQKAAAYAELTAESTRTLAALEDFELQQLLSGENDKSNAFVTVHSGAGGTESCDWAEMLLRMYERWGEHHGFGKQIMDIQEGDEAGIKSATIKVEGAYAFGYLQTERGVHRLVRISPFDSNKRRHTSFASVDVVPELPDDAPIDIDEARPEARHLPFRRQRRTERQQSGNGGADHAHLPSGIIVACQAERSQMKNRMTALKLLKSQADRDRGGQEARRDRAAIRREGRRSLGQPDSQLRVPALSDGQGSADRRGNRRRPGG